MRILEQQCPHCNAKLRLRGPARGGQKLSCPDCSKPLVVADTSNGVSLTAAATEPTSLPGSPSVSQHRVSPTVVAWSVSGALMLLLGWGLLGPEEPTEPPAAPKPTTPVAKDTAELDRQEPALVPQQPVAEPTSSEPPTDAVSINAAPPPDEVPREVGSEKEAEVPVKAPAIPAAPTEAERLAAAQAAREAEAITSIRKRLSLPLASYEMQRPATLRVFVEEMSRLAATWINTNGLGDRLEQQVQVELAATTLDEVLAAGLNQVGLAFEVLPTGIHLSAAK